MPSPARAGEFPVVVSRWDSRRDCGSLRTLLVACLSLRLGLAGLVGSLFYVDLNTVLNSGTSSWGG